MAITNSEQIYSGVLVQGKQAELLPLSWHNYEHCCATVPHLWWTIVLRNLGRYIIADTIVCVLLDRNPCFLMKIDTTPRPAGILQLHICERRFIHDGCWQDQLFFNYLYYGVHIEDRCMVGWPAGNVKSSPSLSHACLWSFTKEFLGALHSRAATAQFINPTPNSQFLPLQSFLRKKLYQYRRFNHHP